VITVASERRCGSGGHGSGRAGRSLRAAPSPPIVSPTTGRAAGPGDSRAAAAAEVS